MIYTDPRFNIMHACMQGRRIKPTGRRMGGRKRRRKSYLGSSRSMNEVVVNCVHAAYIHVNIAHACMRTRHLPVSCFIEQGVVVIMHAVSLLAKWSASSLGNLTSCIVVFNQCTMDFHPCTSSM
jgi:hypothetical protein